ncbi:uncharacterized protein ASPGLDRAFT_47769 [Aspergillus glaucus CBS 516.65]|uniref:Uncharacterized protein n=1 Tax=Aspergillus glaucus CBS 516.65 TaxID=1160497 RepID=A0A1L9VJF0_ASPGL|nr:hypothetical protein ASPGLDRAFT_47769 [Aspergillus glaucus CBS 516.65]OJJ84049.1 hypothetical protein ASPGLDRAFT_47769 [Aspergillus glaucus CBS 516.65]
MFDAGISLNPNESEIDKPRNFIRQTATSSASSNSLYHCPYSSSVESRRISRKNDRGYGRTRSSRRLFGTRVNAFDEIERLGWGSSSLHTIN